MDSCANHRLVMFRSDGQGDRGVSEIDGDHEDKQSVGTTTTAQCDNARNADGDDEGENLAVL